MLTRLFLAGILIAGYFLSVHAQKRFDDLIQTHNRPQFFHEVNHFPISDSLIYGTYTFRLSHDFANFVGKNNQFESVLQFNLEIRYEDGSITRKSKTIVKTVNDFSDAQHRYHYIEDSIQWTKPVRASYLAVDLFDLNINKSLFNKPLVLKLATNKTDLFDYWITGSQTLATIPPEAANWGKNMTLQHDHYLILLRKNKGKSDPKITIKQRYSYESEFSEFNSKLELPTWTPVKNTQSYEYLVYPILSSKLDQAEYLVNYQLGSVKDSIKFKVIWPEMPFSLYDLEISIRTLDYILSDDQFDQLMGGSFETRAENFKNYWKKRDPDPSTSYNPLLAEYYRRVDYAYANLFSLKEYGWRTDRGRIYIIYGEPDQRIKKTPPNEVQRETWLYKGINKQFIFVGPEFTLVDDD